MRPVMVTINDEIRSMIEVFATDVALLVNRAALEAVASLEPVAHVRPRRAAGTQEIRALQEAGVGPVEIARRLGVSRMTVWRKLKAVEGCEA